MEVQGSMAGIAYEQTDKDGSTHYYNKLGYEINSGGELLEVLPQDRVVVKNAPEPAAPEPVEPENAGLSFDKIKADNQPEAPEGELMFVERLKIKAPNDPNYVKKDEVISELQKAGIDHDPKSGRDDLCLMLKEHFGVL